MSSKLCPHSLRPTPDARQWVEAGARLVKLVNDFGSATEYLRINPNIILVGRGYTRLTLLEQYHSGDSPERAAKKFVDEQYARYYKHNPLVKIWEGHNEPSFGSPNDPGATARMSWYGHYEAERLRILDGLGLRGVVGNFSTGYPEINKHDLRMWNAFLPALEAARRYRGLLGVHEYAGPWMWWYCGDYQLGNCPGRGRPKFPGGELGDMGWLTLRYRQVYRYVLEPRGLGRLPLVITECGTDRAGGGCPGMPAAAWKDLVGWWGGWDGSTDPIDYWRTAGRNRDPERYYAEQLIWYDRQLQKDPYVVGATIFTFGADNAIWEPFNVAGTRVTRHLADYIRNIRNEPIEVVDINQPFPPADEPPDQPQDEPGTQPDDTGVVVVQGPRGQPRVQYPRVCLLMPASLTDPAWIEAAASASWPKDKLTFSGSADDAGTGNLHSKIVIALNPETWGHDPPLHAWFARHYPGVVVASLYAQSPADLAQVLRSIQLPRPSTPPQQPPSPPVGRPRVQYSRTYVLLSPKMDDPAWVGAVARATWKKGRFTIGANRDDAGVGDLDRRRVIVLNPQDWGGGMKKWYAEKYPGVDFKSLRVGSPDDAKKQLKQFV